MHQCVVCLLVRKDEVKQCAGALHCIEDAAAWLFPDSLIAAPVHTQPLSISLSGLTRFRVKTTPRKHRVYTWVAKKKKYSIVLKPGKESLLGRFHSSSSGIKGVGGWVGTVVTRLDYRPLQAGLGGAGGLSTWLSCE